MVGGGEFDLDPKRPHDVLVEVGNKRVPVVGHGHVGDAVPGRSVHEGVATLL